MYLPVKGRFSQWSKILLVVVLCLGIFFRFVNLDKKVFWVDEVATAIRVSGYTLKDMNAELIDGPAHTLPQLQKYQYPSSDKTLGDTATSLAAEDVHPPLFFSLLRLWVTVFGDSVTALRSLAAVFSVLMFPAMWWLCRELFSQQMIGPSAHGDRATSRTSPVGWVAIALLALSPAQVVYAQESRQYTLWMLLILLTGASLLRSLRINRWQSWAAYGLLLTLGLYTHYLFMLVVVGHGLYVLCVEQFKIEQFKIEQLGDLKLASLKKFSLRPAQKLISYLIVSAIAGIAYLPWVIFSGRFPTDTSQLSWMDQPPGLIKMGSSIVGVLGRSFVDFGVAKIGSSALMLLVVPLLLLAIGTCLVAVICLVRQTPFKTWFFVATLGGVTAAVVLGSYFVLDKAVATTRFMLPISVSLQIAVAYLLVTGFEQTKPLPGRYFRGRSAKAKSFRQQSTYQAMIWRALGGILLSIGVLSCALRLNEPIWWTQMPDLNQDIPAIAQSINQQKDALVIMDGSKGYPFFNVVQPQSLLHSVNSNAQMRLQIVENVVPDLTKTADQNIFIYLPANVSGMADSPAVLQDEMAKRYNVSLKPVIPGTFWHVSR